MKNVRVERNSLENKPAEELYIEERRERILEILEREGKVKVVDLSKHFAISEVTIRGDLDELEKAGLLERVHGGALRTYKRYYNMGFNDRMETNKEEKSRIAKEAASLISDGDTVFLGSGTTPLYVARELSIRENLIIITNSLSVAQEASLQRHVNVVVLLGGNINAEYQFTSGDDAIHQLNKYKADKMILSSDGVSAEFGVTTFHHLEAELNRRMIARSSKTIVVADHSKIGRAKFSHIENIEKIDCLISSSQANEDDINAIKEKGTEVRLV